MRYHILRYNDIIHLIWYTRWGTRELLIAILGTRLLGNHLAMPHIVITSSNISTNTIVSIIIIIIIIISDLCWIVAILGCDIHTHAHTQESL